MSSKLLASNMSDGSGLGILVIGTIAQKGKKSADSVALIKLKKTGRVKAVKAGFDILEKYTVKSISKKFMVIVDKSKTEHLVYQNKFAREFRKGAVARRNAVKKNSKFLSHQNSYKEDGFERSGNEIKFSQSYRDNIIKNNLQTVLMQATAEPHIENGRVKGFKFSQIDSGSIYDKAGVRDGDVITHVNGIPLKSAGAAITLLKGLRNASNVEFDVNRGGSPQTFSMGVD